MVERLTREELYEKVWSEPVTKVARSYGVSDVGLAKICRRLSIPTPGRGYWRSIKLGLFIEQTPLPPLENTAEKLIELNRLKTPPQKKELTTAERKAAEEKKQENRIRVPDQLISPHPLVEKTLQKLLNAKVDLDGRVRPEEKCCLDVCVGPDSVDRAMRIMDALLKALEARGYTTIASDQEIRVRVDDEDIGFSLAESLERRRRKLSLAEMWERENRELGEHDQLWWYRHRTECIRIPDGRFSLTIDHNSSSIRRRWSDSSTQCVEDRLNSFVASLIRIAENLKVCRRQAEEEERRRKDVERRRLRKERRKNEAQWRIKKLKAKVAAWQHVEQVRAFITAVRAEAIRRHGVIGQGSELARWLNWAERYAIRCDPLAESSMLPTYSPDEETRRKLEPTCGSSWYHARSGTRHPR